MHFFLLCLLIVIEIFDNTYKLISLMNKELKTTNIYKRTHLYHKTIIIYIVSLK